MLNRLLQVLKRKLKTKLKKPNKTENSRLLLIGLGNPGAEYHETRHNAGFMVIDYLAEKLNKPLKKSFLKPVATAVADKENKQIILVKPLTYMNRSGAILDYVMNKYGAEISDIILICDNMDLKPGMIRLRKKGSSAGHNGIKSVIENLGSQDFGRMYIGVGRSVSGQTVIEHVLGKFDNDEDALFKESVEAAAEALLMLKDRTIEQVMNEVNKKNN